jgi:hypothetical protein
MSDYKYLYNVVRIKKLSQQVEKIDILLGEATEKKQIVKEAKLQDEKNKRLSEIDILKEKYFLSLEKIGKNNQAVAAFVTFRSMEGVQRAIRGFKSTRLQRGWFTLFYCCTNSRQKSKLFKNRWLKVEQAVEPELLIWENFGVGRINRVIRILFYLIFVLFMLVLCFYVVSYLEGAQNKA